MPTHTTFKSAPARDDASHSQQLEANVKDFIEWALLEKGCFETVRLPASHATAGAHKLRPAEDPALDDGVAWEAFRKAWVWQSGVSFSPAPVAVSGVWVNGSFHSLSATGAYAHDIDYERGRVLFRTAIPTGSLVCCEYSYHRYQPYTADSPLFRQLQWHDQTWADPHFTRTGSGVFDLLADNRVQLPAYIVEAVTDALCIPYELGSQAQGVNQAVRVHVLGDNRSFVFWLHDALVRQQEKTLILYDQNAAVASGHWPLAWNGTLASGALAYPDMVAQHAMAKARVEQTFASEAQSRLPLTSCVVTWRLSCVLP